MRKLIFGSLVCSVLFSQLVHSEEYLKNGDFELGKKGWKGDGKAALIDGKNVLEIKLKRSKVQDLKQKIDLKDVDAVTIHFKYKCSEDFESNGFYVLVESDGRYSGRYTTIRAVANGEWHERTVTISRLNEVNKPEVIVGVYEGKGSIYFDDFVVEPGS